VVDLTRVRIFLAALSGWLDHQQQDVIAYLIEENRTLRSRLAGRDCGSATNSAGVLRSA
jgi:hypothetical protein